MIKFIYQSFENLLLAVYHFTKRIKTHKLQPCVPGRQPPNLPPKVVSELACAGPRWQGSEARDQMRKPVFRAQFRTWTPPVHTACKTKDSVGSQFCDAWSINQKQLKFWIAGPTGEWLLPQKQDRADVFLSILLDAECRQTGKIYNRTQLRAITCHDNIYDNLD